MKYYIIAGEASGDLHGSNLMKGLLKADKSAKFRFWGGDKMAAVGGIENLDNHYKKASFMGFVEILRNLRTITGQLSICKKEIQNYNPDILILIDYAGFNLRIARFAKEIGLKVFYYISPKVWAWNESRVKLLKTYVDQLFIIFPFEVEYFNNRGVKTIFEGNPLVDAIEECSASWPTKNEFIKEIGLDDRPIIALLSGSRKTEIRYNLPFMVEIAKHFPDYQFVVAGVSWLDLAIYDKYLEGSDVAYVRDKTYELLSVSTAAIVTSGTATLETALIGVPEIVCYKTGALSMFIARMLTRVKYASLVNLILDKEAVRELLQKQMTIKNATSELSAILPGGAKLNTMKSDFATLKQLIGGAGASDRVAKQMVKILTSK